MRERERELVSYQLYNCPAHVLVHPLIFIIEQCMTVLYNETSDSESSMIETQYNKPLNKGHFNNNYWFVYTF